MRAPFVGWSLLLVSAKQAGAEAAAETPVHDALLGLPFANSDTVLATDVFDMRSVSSIYLEPEAPQFAEWAWADGRIARAMPSRPHGAHYYLFKKNDSAVAPTAPPPGAPPAANASMLAGWSVPPAGMRSAPPLGGWATGTVELRADGSLHAWTIENNSPAGSTKLATLDDATLGVRVGKSAKLLRTHPPQGLPGVAGMEFSGAQPFTRLRPQDPSLSDAAELAMFGRSRWRVGDMEASGTPAVAFTLTASNPSETAPLELSFFFALPLSLQRGVIRSTTDAANGTAGGAEACRAACAANATCAGWSYGGGCQQYAEAALPSSRNTDAAHAASGVKGVGQGPGWELRDARPAGHPRRRRFRVSLRCRGGWRGDGDIRQRRDFGRAVANVRRGRHSGRQARCRRCRRGGGQAGGAARRQRQPHDLPWLVLPTPRLHGGHGRQPLRFASPGL